MKRKVTTDTTVNLSIRYTIRLSNHLAHELDMIAQQTQQPHSVLIRAALTLFLDAYYDNK